MFLDQINQFLKVVDVLAMDKFFVHCAGGRHRTGVVGAVYRFNHDHWNLEQALAEMDQYEFGSGYGHDKQRNFVKDYWDQIRRLPRKDQEFIIRFIDTVLEKLRRRESGWTNGKLRTTSSTGSLRERAGKARCHWELTTVVSSV